jgi:hypothetical protein
MVPVLTLVLGTAAHAEGLSPAPAPCTYEPGSGTYGYNVGADENFTPVVQDYSLVGLVETNACTTAQLELSAVPATGTPMSCTLFYPVPYFGQETGCDNVTGTEALLQPGTSVKLTATFVGVGPGGASRVQFSCTTTAPAAPKGDYGMVYVSPVNGSMFNWNVGSVRCHF